MTIEEIRELIALVIESGVAEIEVQRGENRVRIRRTLGAKLDGAAPSAGVSPTTIYQVGEPAASGMASGVGVSSGVAAVPATAHNEVIVKSPIVGTYYDAPKPGDPSFVRVGDSVEPGQVLCIIESMKLMNEIESEVAGTVVAKLMENGRPVEYGEALFAIRPR